MCGRTDPTQYDKEPDTMPENKYADERERGLDDVERATFALRDLVAAQRTTNISYRDEDLITAAGRVAEAAARLAGGEYRRDYNGHKNRETWNTALWIDNEQGSSEYARSIVAEHVTDPEPGDYDDDPALDRRVRIRNAADALKDWYDETFSPTRPGNVVDAWMYAIAVTDWYSIAEGIAEDMTTPAQDRAAAASVEA